MNSSNWISNFLGKCKSVIAAGVPTMFKGIVLNSPQKIISDAIAAKIKDEAATRAYAMLAETHRIVINTVLWQNALLLVSILPVYYLRSAIPFYIAYVCVAGYSALTFVQSWPQIIKWIKLRSMVKMLQSAVLEAIEDDLCKRQFYERKVVEYLGPDLEQLAHTIALRLLPDIRAAIINMGLTLLMAFIAFRLTAIPMLEHHAL